MDLVALQEKINNYITVVSSWVRNVGKLYFSSTAEDVTVQMIDDNGNVVDTTLPNVAKFRKTVWDDIGGALGQFDKRIYVDSMNGDDLNSGSLSSPFKTIEKALSVIVNASSAVVYLEPDMDYNVSGYRTSIGKELNNCYIYFRSRDISLPNPRVNFIWTDDITNTYSSIPGFLLSNSFLHIYFVDLTVPNYTGTLTYSLPCIIHYNTKGSSVMINNGKLNVGDTGVINDSYVYSGNSLSFYAAKIITDNAANTINIQSPISLYFRSSTTIEDSAGTALTASDIVGGIVKDTNGIPRNIISNEIF